MKPILILVTFIYSIICFGQKNEQLDIYSFTINDKEDFIQFIKTGIDLEKVKPTIIFCQGSLPIPLICEDEKGIFLSSFPFDYKKLTDKYHFVVISTPHTPLKANVSQLNHQYAYVRDITILFSYDFLYLQDNYMENYLKRANKVIDFLIQQKWVDKQNIAVLGHSQGAYIVTMLAKINPNISTLGYFSGNPDGKYSQL